MKHVDCKYYIHLDVEKGMCGLTKLIVPIDGVGSEACTKFVEAEKCGNCKNFTQSDKYGIGLCTGLEKENWAYSSCGACGCSGYQAK